MSRIGELADAHLAYGDLRADPWFLVLATSSWRARGIGDFLMFCLLAEGAVDVVLGHDGDRLWDLAAPMLVVTEAGGCITDPAGQPWASSPVALLLDDIFGGAIELFLSFIVLAIYACGTVILATGSRLAWAMARDRRLPGHRKLSRVPKASGGPRWATGVVATASAAIVVSLSSNPDALVTLFTAATLLPAILYTATVLLYARTARRDPGQWAGFA